MARQVEFHGKIIVHPGAEAYVDVSGMAQPGVDETRIAGLIAEAPHGQPGVVHVFADTAAAKEFFGVGSDAANGIQLLMEPSNDVDVVGGAVLVYVYKPNRSTRAERWLVLDPVAGRLTKTVLDAEAYDEDRAAPDLPNAFVEFADSGEAENTYQNLIVEVVSGWGKGQQRQIASSLLHPTSGNQRLYLRQDLDWKVVPRSATNVSTLRIAIPQWEVLASVWGPRGLNNDIDFGPAVDDEAYEIKARYLKNMEVQPSSVGGLLKPSMLLRFDPTGGGSLAEWTDPSNWLIPQAQDGALPVEGTCTAAATVSSLDGATNALTLNTNANKWAIITGTNPAKPAQANLLGKVFKIKTNTAGVGAAGIVVPFESLPGTFPAGDLVGLQWKVFGFTDAYIEKTGYDGECRALKAIARDFVGAWTLTLMDLDLTKYASLDELIRDIDDVPGMDATLGDGQDSSVLPTRFDFGPAADDYGRERFGFIRIGTGALPVGTTSIPLETGGAFEGTDPFPLLYPFPVILDEGGNDEEVVWVSNNNTGTDVLTIAAPGTTKAHGDGQVVALAGNGEVGYRLGSQLVRGPGDTDNQQDQVVKDNNQKFVEFVPRTYGRFNFRRAEGPGSTTYRDQIGASQAENNSDVYKPFYNGLSGTSVMLKPEAGTPNYPVSWEHGMEELLKVEGIKAEVLAVSEDLPGWTAGQFDTLLTMFKTHMNACEDARHARSGYMGAKKPLRKGTYGGQVFNRGLLDWIRLLNEERMALLGQNTQVFASDGVETILPPWAYACQAAGIQLGTDIGEGLTLKYIKTGGLYEPFGDWDPRDPLDQREALLGGLFFGEPYKGRWRVVRGQTTHISTDNLVRTDINVWEIRNYVRETLQDKLEDRFGGAGIGVDAEGVRFVAPARVSSIKDYAATLLEEMRADGIIVDSEDEQGRPQHAWRALKVRITGDVCYISVLAYPKTALNFILIDIFFQLPTLTA